MRQRRQSAATTAAGTSKSRSGKSSVASSRRNSEAAPAAGASQPRTQRARTASNASSKPPSTAKAGEAEDVFDSDEDDEPTEEEQERQGYIADIERESQPHIVHVSTDNLFSCDLICGSPIPQQKQLLCDNLDMLNLLPTFYQPSPFIRRFGREPA